MNTRNRKTIHIEGVHGKQDCQLSWEWNEKGNKFQHSQQMILWFQISSHDFGAILKQGMQQISGPFFYGSLNYNKYLSWREEMHFFKT